MLQALAEDAVLSDPMSAVEAGLQALFDMASDPRVARVCWLEVLGVSPRVDAVYTRTFERFASLVVAFARQRFPNFDVSDDEARVLGYALIGAVSLPVQQWLLGGYQEERATLVAATARVYRSVIASLA